MTTNEYTVKEFADAFNPPFTRQGILKNIKSGILKGAEGPRGFLINITENENKEFIKNSERKFTEKSVKLSVKKQPEIKKPVKDKKQKLPQKTKSVAVIKPQLPEKKKHIKDEKIPDDIIKKLDDGKLSTSELLGFPKVMVEKIKLYEQTKQIIQKRQQERRELINAKLFRITLGKLFEIHTNEFMTIKSKAVAQIAGIFGSTDEEKKLQSEKILDEELWSVLKHIKIEFNKILTKIGNEPIK